MKTAILSLTMIMVTTVCFSQDAEFYFRKAENKYEVANYNGAIEFYTKALELDPEHLNSYLRRGFCYGASGKYDEAIKDYDKVIGINPGHTFALISRGSAKNKLKRYKEAMKDFSKVLSIDPDNQEAYNNRGWSKEFLGDHSGACADWKKSKKLGNEEAKIIMKNTNCK